MTTKELIAGEYYFTIVTDHPEWDRISRSRGGAGLGAYLQPKNKNFTSQGEATGSTSSFSGSYENIHRLATLEEIAWLKACEKANKFVPLPVLEDAYPIF